MTKLLQVILVLLAGLSLAACGGGGVGSDTPAGGGGGPGNGNASATISWTAPTARVDGSAIAMSELGGYKIYYGTDSSSLSTIVTITNSSQFSYQFNNLQRGSVYYFRVTAYDMGNSESQMSNRVTRTAS